MFAFSCSTPERWLCQKYKWRLQTARLSWNIQKKKYIYSSEVILYMIWKEVGRIFLESLLKVYILISPTFIRNIAHTVYDGMYSSFPTKSKNLNKKLHFFSPNLKCIPPLSPTYTPPPVHPLVRKPKGFHCHPTLH